MMDKINRYLNKFNYDIRTSKDARFIDQKVTPDVLSIIADCVLQFTEDNNSLKFTTKDIWESDYANVNVKDIFNKPDVMTKSAKSEYDKFFQQPLKMLSYSKILECKKEGNKNIFKVQNRNLLEFISIKERNSLDFIVIYLEKVLKDSEIWVLFNKFFEENNKENFKELKDGFRDFLYENTGINNTNKHEPGRIFTKVINPLAYSRKKHGTKGGIFSNDIITYDELMYNRRNWRDIAKLKGETRQAHEERAKKEVKKSKEAFVNHAKEKIRRYHFPNSEVHDKYSVGNATQVHHIFPRNSFPQLEAILENLILLTATQHNAYAHPNNNTRYIDKDYQLACLLAKCSSVQKSISEDDGLYSKNDFVYVLNEGVVPNDRFSEDKNLTEIEEKIVYEYNAS